MNPTQTLATQRRITRQFIDLDPKVIVLVPHTRVKQSTGGWMNVPGTPRDPQTFKLISMTIGVKPVVVQDGVERAVDYTLLGTHDAVMAVGDTWEADGRRFEIVAMDDGHDYEVKGLVVAHG